MGEVVYNFKYTHSVEVDLFGIYILIRYKLEVLNITQAHFVSNHTALPKESHNVVKLPAQSKTGS